MRMCNCTVSTGRSPEPFSGRNPRVKHLDAIRFEQQAGGNPALMVRIAQAFVGQLPSWRADYLAAHQQSATLGALCHKMKGSCQAITAFDAAEIFTRGEKALQSPGPLPDDMYAEMLVLVAELEAELNDLIKLHGRG